MTREEAKECALRWMDEATANGHPVSAEEIADYRDRMDFLMDGIVTELGAVFPLYGTAEYEISAEDRRMQPLPTDFRRFRRMTEADSGRDLTVSCDGRMVRFPPECAGSFLLHYERKPVSGNVLDCAPEAEPLVPLRLAADLLIGTAERAQSGRLLADRFYEAVQRMQTTDPELTGISTVYAM